MKLPRRSSGRWKNGINSMPEPTWSWLESVSNTAKMLRVSRQAVRKAIMQKRIPARKIGETWVVDIREIDEWMIGGKKDA